MDLPQLSIVEKSTSELRGACSACGRRFHAFIRGKEAEATWLLERGFKMHCRRVHSLVVQPALPAEEMVEGLPLPAYVCSKKTRKLMATNHSFRMVMGYTAEEATELRLDDLRAPQDIPLLIKSLRGHSGGGTLERRYRTKDGRFLNVRLRYQDISLFQNDTPIHDARFVVLTNMQPLQGA